MEQRNYNQYCATARTLDLVGERWTLLLVRELLTGPKRFSDLQHSLRGLGTGLLAARMKHLEHEGLAHKVTLPPPARTPAYALTQAGADLEPVVMALARWGLTWAMDEPREQESFHPGWAVLGLKACFDPVAAAGLRALYEFRVEEEVFHARVDDGTIETVHGPAQHPDAVVTTGREVFRDLAAGRTTLEGAIGAGAASVTGDGEALRRLRGLFRLPPQRTRHG
ncbi:winged helix-turn-helix transcriptional regulator [Nonomuraea soli]|uniref:DNA-binding HxlR family transcriptional regulator n=1 Tax=Nonomuraea soli TaxID=1032476 RepID=A0A7W0CHI3_9ACTN|nr:winged helix-turn-helix transcriptional regulator [Nonomuraea soli]MBA2891298.1 DNA-binding HxlR family transcriptional regulator [Nonomuraea soli]